jgi:hypothetical protein
LSRAACAFLRSSRRKFQTPVQSSSFSLFFTEEQPKG